ncbi:MAG: lysoplasmalogenase [Pontixanthobacter sp.]
MPKRALVERRPWLLASVASAIVYYLIRDNAVDETLLIYLKGAGAAFLAVYAIMRHKGFDGWLVAAVMALASLGDMLIELELVWGGAAFFASHCTAIYLYLRHRRKHPTSSQKAAALALIIVTPLVCWLLSNNPGIGIYGIALGAMAATAWLSKFPRYRVGLGAVLFVISDWLIFWNVGSPGDNVISGYLIWPLYFSGIFLIATGSIQSLHKTKAK